MVRSRAKILLKNILKLEAEDVIFDAFKVSRNISSKIQKFPITDLGRSSAIFGSEMIWHYNDLSSYGKLKSVKI